MYEANIKLSFPFMYSKEVVENLGESNFKKISSSEDYHPENLLSYVDRLYSKNLVCNYKVEEYFIHLFNQAKNEMFLLDLKEVTITFFADEIAFLNLHLKVKYTSVEELYKINKYITNIYTKTASSNPVFVHLSKKNALKINMEKEKFQSGYLECFNKEDCMEIDALMHSEDKFKQIVVSEIKFKKYTKDGLEFIEISGLNDSKLSQSILERHCKEQMNFYTPYKKDKRDYPFSPSKSDEETMFKGRVGFNHEEYQKIKGMNENFDPEHMDGVNRHYLYFENQLKIFENAKEKEEFIHYDTFLTSLILEFVKPNKGYMFYDNFNPLATSYLNNYITIEVDTQTLQEEIKSNYITYEPLVSIKTKKGSKIESVDFFEAFQSQADIITIGNTHSIVHLIGNGSSSLVNNKLTTHYFVYQLTLFQKVKILNIINQTILNNNGKNFVFRIWRSYKNMMAINEQVDEFKKFLTNYNFSVISNSASVDASYKFFRKCNDVDKLAGQWNTISLKFGDFKEIFAHSFGIVAVIILLLPLLFAYGQSAVELFEWISDFFQWFDSNQAKESCLISYMPSLSPDG